MPGTGLVVLLVFVSGEEGHNSSRNSDSAVCRDFPLLHFCLGSVDKLKVMWHYSSCLHPWAHYENGQNIAASSAKLQARNLWPRKYGMWTGNLTN